MTNYDDAFSVRPFTLRLIVSLQSQNIAANQSTVAWTLRIIRTGNYESYSLSGNTYSVVLNGTTADSGSWTYDFRGTDIGDYQNIDSGTRTITHNADGTKTFSLSDSATGTSIGSASKSGTYVLPTIPRASTPTFDVGGTPVTTIDAGSAVDINMNRASTDFTHTVSYSFGSQSGVIATGVATEQSWTPPVTLLTEIPNAVSGAVNIIVDTYDDLVLIGQKTVPLTLTAGSSATPDFTTVTHAEDTTSPNVASIVGAYVKGISALDVAITGAVGYQGSTISSYKIELLNGATVLQTINAVSGTTTLLTTSGSLTLRGTVTDSRGKTHSEDVSITVMSYVTPTIAGGTVANRANSGGTISPTGTYIRVDLVATVQSLVVGTQKNDLKYRVRIKQTSDGTAWSSVSPAASSSGIGAVSISTEVHPGTYSIANSYYVRVEIEDNLGQISAVVLTVATGGALMHMSKTNDGIGVGKYWQQGSVDALAQMYQNNGLSVIDTGDVATTGVAGIVELATNTETNTGTDADRAVTPAGLKYFYDQTIDPRLDAEEASTAVFNAQRPDHATFTTSSSIVIDGLTGYDEYEITIDISASSATSSLAARVRSGGSSVSTGTYQYQIIDSASTTMGAASAGAATSWPIGASRDEKTFTIRLLRFNEAIRTTAIGYGGGANDPGTSSLMSRQLWARQSGATAWDGIEFFPSSGTVTGVYTVRKIAYT